MSHITWENFWPAERLLIFLLHVVRILTFPYSLPRCYIPFKFVVGAVVLTKVLIFYVICSPIFGKSSSDSFCDFFRFHVMSRDDRTGFVYSGDLYPRRWELERESSHRNLGLSLSRSPSEQQDHQIRQNHQHGFRHPNNNIFCVSICNLCNMAWVITCVVMTFFWVLAW